MALFVKILLFFFCREGTATEFYRRLIERINHELNNGNLPPLPEIALGANLANRAHAWDNWMNGQQWHDNTIGQLFGVCGRYRRRCLNHQNPIIYEQRNEFRWYYQLGAAAQQTSVGDSLHFAEQQGVEAQQNCMQCQNRNVDAIRIERQTPYLILWGRPHISPALDLQTTAAINYRLLAVIWQAGQDQFEIRVRHGDNWYSEFGNRVQNFNPNQEEDRIAHLMVYEHNPNN